MQLVHSLSRRGRAGGESQDPQENPSRRSWLGLWETIMGEVRRLLAPEPAFGIQAAARLMLKILPPWMQELSLLVEGVEAIRPPGAVADWQPGATVRLPFNRRLCADGKFICSQALMAAADAAMMVACSAAWNGYRAMTVIDQTTHFLRPVSADIVADARIVRSGRTTSFGHIMLFAAHDKRPAGMVSSAYAIL
jgi:acyl-coenzyme A thioesterase PaaI-like protein